MTARLDDVLVVTVRKSFWASPEAETFPRRIYARVLYGHSTNLLNSALVALRSLLSILVSPPRLVVLGSVERLVPWFVRARRVGLLRGARLLVTNQLHLDDEQLQQVDRVILYARPLIESARPALRSRAAFAYLPADGDFAEAGRAAVPGRYVFTGGGADRDFVSLVDAIAGTELQLEIVTFALDALGTVPANCVVRGPMPPAAFLTRMAGSLLVAVALRDPASPHGQTTVVQALSLGKAVVATRAPGIVDYVRDGREGLLVEPGDVGGYRAALQRLVEDEELRRSCEANARERSALLTYASFREALRKQCSQLLEATR
jgi:glycosyltransferase involved in cell wall biosynthesis